MVLPRDVVKFGSSAIILFHSVGMFLSEDDLACVWLCPRFPSEQSDKLTLGTPSDSASHDQMILTTSVSNFLKGQYIEVTNSKNQISFKLLCSFDISYCSISHSKRTLIDL